MKSAFTIFNILLLLILFSQLSPLFAQWQKNIIDNDINLAVSVDVADMVGDTKLDLIVTNFNGSKLILYQNNFPQWIKHTVANVSATFAYSGDMDGDDTLDIVASLYRDKDIVWYENNHPTWTKHIIDANTNNTDFMLVADFDNDDTLDVVTAGDYTFGGDVVWYENNHPIWNKHIIESGSSKYPSLTVADIDGDGFLDLAATMNIENKVVWFRNENGGLSWTKHPIDNDLAKAWGINSYDINGDKKIDILATGQSANSVVWYENNYPFWTKHSIDADLRGANWVDIADVNGDDKIDVIASGFSADDVVWYENNHPIWNKNIIDSNLDAPRVFAVTDIDGDNTNDLVVPAQSSVVWYKNPYTTTEIWTDKTNMQNERQGHSSGLLDGKIYVLGGVQYNNATTHYNAIKSMEFYDANLDKWIEKADMITGRVQFPTCIYDGKIWAIGGGQSVYWDALTSIETYDPLSDTWTHVADLPGARMGHTASLVDGKIYIIGGADSNEMIPLSEIIVYDPLTDTWDSTKTDMPTARMNLEAVVLNGKIYVIGGHGGSPGGEMGLKKVEVYDPATDEWEEKADMIWPRKYFSATVLDSIIYVFGGASGFCTSALATIEAYDPVIDNWTPKTDMANKWVMPATTSLNGKIYVSGGTFQICPPSVVKTMRVYNPAQDTLVTGIINVHNQQQPASFTICQNYPNPFNPGTTIKYSITKQSKVTLKVFDVLGSEISTLVNKEQSQGNYEVEFDGSELTSGIYFYRLQAGDFVETRKMILLK